MRVLSIKELMRLARIESGTNRASGQQETNGAILRASIMCLYIEFPPIDLALASAPRTATSPS